MSKYSKYIESDIHNGITFLKCAIMNIFADLECKDKLELDLSGKYISCSLIEDCAKERGYIEVSRETINNSCISKFLKGSIKIGIQGNLTNDITNIWRDNEKEKS